MADVVTPEKRSQMMAGIGGKNTKPELIIRKGLHAKGYRYRLHVPTLPGKPDLVFPRYKAAIFVNGCFWHGHGCHLFKWPSTRQQFWKEKISGTIERDKRKMEALHNSGWRTLTIWECALKGKTCLPADTVIEVAADWLSSDLRSTEVTGFCNVIE